MYFACEKFEVDTDSDDGIQIIWKPCGIRTERSWMPLYLAHHTHSVYPEFHSRGSTERFGKVASSKQEDHVVHRDRKG